MVKQFFTKTPVILETHTMEFPYNDILIPAQVLEFHVATHAGSLTVTAARLIYKKLAYNAWIDLIKEAFKPAGVIDARYR